MRLEDKAIELKGTDGIINILRNRFGVPEISAKSAADLAYGLGWVHANDRMLQIMLLRVIFQGRASEFLADDPALLELDRHMRRYVQFPDMESEIEKLTPESREQLDAYCRGVNYFMKDNSRIFEFRLLGYKPDEWAIADILVLSKYFGYFGLVDAQAGMQKLLIEMVQNGVEEKKLRELFPYLNDKIDYELIKKIKLMPPLTPEATDWYDKIPKFRASNNWAVSGKLTRSGKPILAGDPHLEVNRIPSIWYEAVMRLPDNNFIGVTVPGVPGIIIGRNNSVAWSATYSFMDMIDYRAEECKNGKYRKGDRWIDFNVREEEIITKKKKKYVEKIYENEFGVLEGDPNEEGYYITHCWSAAKECGAGEINCVTGLMKSKTVQEARKCFRQLDAASFNWMIADSSGNIGWQMSGRLFRRSNGFSGLLPVLGRDKKYDSRGFVDKMKLPAEYNPKSGILATSNQDLNQYGSANPINLPMAPYRADMVTRELKGKKDLTVEDMKAIQYSLYSLQAEKFMKILAPFVPDTENGKLLKEWDFQYKHDSVAASIFENIYILILKKAFGDYGIGRDVIEYLMNETPIFNDYFGNFDNIIFKSNSAWFKDRKRDDILKEAVVEGLETKALPYGETRMIPLSHLLFGGKLPSFMGFDLGPISLPGNRSTICQGQIFRSGGRVTTFSPSFRFVTDMNSERIHCNIAGGPSDRRFSKWYKTDLANWLNGIYKVLE